MQSGLKFTKMCAGGNDFIVIDNRFGICTDGASLALRLCKRSYSAGADGLLLLEKGKKSDQFKMRIFNPDGSEAEMCGNGARCIAAFASRKGISGSKVNLETHAGLISAEVIGPEVRLHPHLSPPLCLAGGRASRGRIKKRGKGNSCKVRLKMCEPSDIRLSLKLSIDDREYITNFINTGVPHTVLIVEDLKTIDIELGKKIRYNELFQPQGTNVDFVEVIDRQKIRLRTYERGVEAETLACGTGAVAGAIVSYLLGKVSPPVSAETGGGHTLVIHFKPEDEKVTEVYLEGDATFVYEGELIREVSR